MRGCRLWIALLALGLLSAASLSAEAAGVLYLVRHGEPIYPPPNDAPTDPPLNVMGQDRADALARLLANEPIDRILSSDYRRTRETAAPLAQALGLEVELYDPYELEVVAAQLASLEGRVVVVGHSNTTHELVRLLGGEAGEPIDESREFGRLYVLVRSSSGVETVRLAYGAPVPENWRDLARTRRE